MIRILRGPLIQNASGPLHYGITTPLKNSTSSILSPAVLEPVTLQDCLRVVFLGSRNDTFFLVLAATLGVLAFVAPNPTASWPKLVDWPIIAALTGLLLLTKGLEVSGALHRLGRALIGFMATERAVALCLVMTAAMLPTVLTNDVALFVVVPLTQGVCRLTKMPGTKLIVFEALGVNAGPALTPIGNPQNLFLWQLSNVSFGHFVWHMLSLVAVLTGALLVLTAFTFGSRPVRPQDDQEAMPLDRPLLGMSLTLCIPFLVVTDLPQASWAVAAVLAVFLVLRPRVLAQLDWGLLLVFVLMFIDLRLLAGMGFVRNAMHGLGLQQPLRLYLVGVGASQFVSNVPAAIALAEYSKNWRVIAYGVNVGDFGLMVGSMANLIALRLSGDRKAWVTFHAYAVPALFVALALGYALMFIGNVL